MYFKESALFDIYQQTRQQDPWLKENTLWSIGIHFTISLLNFLVRIQFIIKLPLWEWSLFVWSIFLMTFLKQIILTKDLNKCVFERERERTNVWKHGSLRGPPSSHLWQYQLLIFLQSFLAGWADYTCNRERNSISVFKCSPCSSLVYCCWINDFLLF